jgi:hypothetical protein
MVIVRVTLLMTMKKNKINNRRKNEISHGFDSFERDEPSSRSYKFKKEDNHYYTTYSPHTCQLHIFSTQDQYDMYVKPRPYVWRVM